MAVEAIELQCPAAHDLRQALLVVTRHQQINARDLPTRGIRLHHATDQHDEWFRRPGLRCRALDPVYRKPNAELHH